MKKLLDEAYSVKEYQEAGMLLSEIGAEVGHSVEWVQLRCMINELPPVIRKEFMDTNFNNDMVRELFHVRNNPMRAKQIIEEYKSGRSKGSKEAGNC